MYARPLRDDAPSKVYACFSGHVMLEPDVKISCDGRWGVHFMASKTISNGSDTYTCCFIPDINQTLFNVQTVKGKGWPDGYLIPNGTCSTSNIKCNIYEPPNCKLPRCFDSSFPPCVACVSCRYQVSLVVLGCLLATMFRYWNQLQTAENCIQHDRFIKV